MDKSRLGEKEVEVKKMTDEIKKKCYIGLRGDYVTPGYFRSQLLDCMLEACLLLAEVRIHEYL